MSATTNGPLTAARALRQQLDDGWVFMAGCYDAMSARIAESVGFTALHVTGFGVEVSQIGAPDIGIITATELASHIARLSAAVDVPLLVDVDTGFGGTLNVRRTVREIERAGAGGLHIEDQFFPKRAAGTTGAHVLPSEDAVARVAAAVDARLDPDFVIVGRTDVASYSFAEAVRRSNLYLEAGADVAMPLMSKIDGVPISTLDPAAQMDVLRRMVAQVDGPVLGTRIPPGYTLDDMRDAGFAMLIIGGLSLHAAATAILGVLREAIHDGRAADYLAQAPHAYSSAAMKKLFHKDEYVEIESRFGTG
jgi:2-methylisocitrate lyase-like PEP mutase family enzyme